MQKKYIIFAINMENRGKKIKMNLLVDNMMEKSIKYNEYIGKITKSDSPVLITGLTFASKSFIVGNTISSLNKKNNDGQKNIYYYILENELDVEKKKRDIEYFTQGIDIEILEFPKKDIRDFDIVSESLEIYIKRMQVFSKILDKNQGRLKKDVVVILSIEAMMQRLLPLNILMKNNISLKKDQEIALDLIIEKLIIMGYKREDVAENMGEFSVKGGILDISTEKEQGLRVEFWGDIITSIRTYSNISQKSLKEREEALILPLTEYIFEKNIEEIIIDIKENKYEKKNKDEIEKILKSKKSKKIKKDKIFEESLEDIERLTQGETNQLIEKYIDYFYDTKEYLADYILENDYIFLDNYIKLSERSYGVIKEAENQNSGLIEREKLLNQALDNMCIYENILEKISEKKIKYIYLEEEKQKILDKYIKKASKNEIDFNFIEYSFLRTELQNLEKIIIDELNKNEKIYIISYENYNYILEDIIKKKNLDNKKIIILKGKISKGFKYLEKNIEEENTKYIKENLIKNDFLDISIDSETNRNNEKRVGKNSLFTNAENIIFADLEQGDYIVHRINGIGKFIEIKKVEVQGISKDYIKVEYKDGDYLYVPTDDLSNVRKFVGAARKCTKT
mgnify:FL=1